ncbi:hypothetical protein M2428_000074 [Arthrobacter sp. ES3-54]|nr:hypothetical protein [Arthrobacter sp. ES3-54]
MRYERESIEFQPVTVTVDGAVVTTGVTFAITPHSDRPVTYIAPTTVAGKTGVMVQGLTPGLHAVWAKVASTPEAVVINCGTIIIT